MSEIATGHCLCGDVTFEYRGELGGASYCHCEDCRRHTGSAFNIVIGVSADKFHLTGAAPSAFTKLGDSGREITRHFCPRCGSPVYGSSPTLPNRIYIKAGALDDPSKVVATHQSWFACAVAWAFITPGLPKFERNPKP